VAQARLKRLREGYRAEEKRQAEEDWKAAQADLKLAQEEISRVERLFKQSASSKSELDSARSAVDRLRSRAEAMRARNELYKTGSRPEDIAEGEAAVKQAKANYELLRNGTRSEEKYAAEARVAEARARLAEIEANLKEATIKAPENCLVEVVAVRTGDLVLPNQPILRVLRTDDLWVKIYVPETELGRVQLHRKVEVAVDCFRDRHFEGEVYQISSESEFTPRNVQSVDERKHQVFGVKVRVADPQGVFKSGMAAEVWVPLN
jgi:HlyD family secretion protein